MQKRRRNYDSDNFKENNLNRKVKNMAIKN